MGSKVFAMAKSVRCYRMEGVVDLKGFIRNGLDSSTLINLIVAFNGRYDEYRKRGFSFPPNLFFCHEVSYSEVIGVLISRHGFTHEEAAESFRKLKAEFHLSEIVRLDSDEDYEKLAAEANNRVIARTGKSRLKIGGIDIIIIGGFLREKVNVVHTGDEGFLETCRELGLNVISLPERDRNKENEIKRLMRKRMA